MSVKYQFNNESIELLVDHLKNRTVCFYQSFGCPNEIRFCFHRPEDADAVFENLDKLYLMDKEDFEE